MQTFIILSSVFCASFLGTMTGFGIGTLLVPVVLNFIPFLSGMIFAAFIHGANSVWKLIFWGKYIKKNIVLFFLMTCIPATLMGSLLLGIVPHLYASKILGVFLIVYGIIFFRYPTIKMAQHPFTLAFGGVIAGLSAGFFGIHGEIKSAMLNTYHLPKEVYIGTLGALSLMIDLTRIGGYFYQLEEPIAFSWWLLFIAVIISFCGAKLAEIYVKKINTYYFRIIVLGALIITGIKFIIFD